MNFKKEQGSIMISVLLVMTVLLLFITAYLGVLSAELTQSSRHDNRIQAYYLARSGAEAIAEFIIKNPSTDLEKGLPDLNLLVDNASLSYQLETTGLENGVYNKVNIETEALFRGVPETLTLQLRLQWLERSIFDNAVFVDGEMDMKNNATVAGDVSTTIGYIINEDPERVDGTIYKNVNVEFPDIDQSYWEGEAYIEIPGQPFVLADDKFEQYRRVDQIDLKGNDNFQVKGEGVLHLLVEDSMTLSGNASILTDQDAKLLIYILSEQTKVEIDIDLLGTPVLETFIYAPHSAINWSGAGKGNLTGGLIVKEFIFPASGGADITIEYDNEIPFDELNMGLGEFANYLVPGYFERGAWSR